MRQHGKKKGPDNERAHLKIIPLGIVDELILSILAANLQALMGLNVDVRSRQPEPEYAYQHVRCQYDAGRILNALASDVDPVPLCLGVTAYDICTPILAYVFGESQLGGKAALISLFRLRHEERDLTFERATKIALHEVGHILGIHHCRKAGCLMRFSSNLENLDQLHLWFCEACAFEIARRLRHLWVGSS